MYPEITFFTKFDFHYFTTNLSNKYVRLCNRLANNRIENDDGTHTEWGFELGAPPRLRRSGISPNFWQEGDALTLKTNPLKDGRPAGSLRGAINAAGKTFGNTDGLQPPTD